MENIEAEVVETVQPIREVVIDAVAAMRIVKHCNESQPTMVAGSLLGIDIEGVLEVTYSFAFPVPKTEADVNLEGVEDLDGAEYQMEMMKMLRDVNVDNNCVGWYQSMYMGTVCTNDVVNYQYSYQSSEELSDNSIVIMYDPTLSKRGDISLKAFRLSEKFMEMKRNKINKYIKPTEILEELPLSIRTQGHSSAFLRCLQDSHEQEMDCDFDILNMSNNEAFLEKHMELLGSWVDDIVGEQQKFLQYIRNNSKLRLDHLRWLTKRVQENKKLREDGEMELSLKLEESGMKPLPDVPSRNDHLLMLAQLDRYCHQLNDHLGTTIHKLALTSQVNNS